MHEVVDVERDRLGKMILVDGGRTKRERERRWICIGEDERWETSSDGFQVNEKL